MPKRTLSIALQSNPLTRPILDGAIVPEGIELIPSNVHSGELIWRQLKFQEFDVAQMSLPTLYMLSETDNCPWVALPVFPYRAFFHTWFMVRPQSDIHAPSDLHNKRVALSEYIMTAAVWIRGILSDEYGVDPQKIEWFEERAKEQQIGTAIGFVPPETISLHAIPAGDSSIAMLKRGEIDAVAVHITERTLLDRSGDTLDALSKIQPLFADPIEENARYYSKTKIFPINHAIALRKSLFETEPWMAMNLYHAFLEAAQRYFDENLEMMNRLASLGMIPSECVKHSMKNPYEYGIKANRNVLTTLARYCVQQGLTKREVAIEEIFAPNTLLV